MTRRRFLQTMGAGTIALSASGMASAQREQAKQPNIIFMLADDLGYGDLGCYGQEVIQTPNLDRLAAEGQRFTQFYAGSTVCAPSRCCLMTGMHTGRAFIRGNGKENLRPEDVTVAEVLKSAGYKTGLVGKWGLGHEGSTGVPTKKGFDEFFGYLDQSHAHNYYPHFLVRNETRVPLKNVVPEPGIHGQGVATKKVEYSHDLITAEALNFIERHRDGPFFLYLALTIPHANNEARQAGMEAPDYGIYANEDWDDPEKGFAAMVTRMDTDVGRILAALQQYGIDENTLIVFTSDNGPHQEGGHKWDFFDSNGALRGIKRDLYEGGIRVPTIVRWPGVVEAGTTSDFVGAFWDVLPMLAEVGGATERVPQGIDGLSFLPAMLGQDERQKQHDYLYWACYERGGAQAVRIGDWKAVAKPAHAPIELYDLSTDIGEQHNIADAHPDIVAQAKAAMEDAYTPSERWRFPEPSAGG